MESSELRGGRARTDPFPLRARKGFFEERGFFLGIIKIKQNAAAAASPTAFARDGPFKLGEFPSFLENGRIDVGAQLSARLPLSIDEIGDVGKVCVAKFLGQFF